jgi:hypothetical protein
MVIAINLNADLLGRGGTIASHGFEENDELDEPPRTPHRWREGISIDRFMKRQVFGGVGRPGLATVMIEATTYARPHNEGAAGGRSAGYHDQSTARKHRLD